MQAHALFSYGTLQQREVQVATFGRELAGRRDAIVGFEVGTLVITDPAVIAASGSDRHPALRRSVEPAAEVAGTVFELTEDEIVAADRYEVDDYERVRAPLRSGASAWVYVLRS
jgi:gamma-glutamylcyclotransferase (GGCT)/AIG2-like uncharacterized protein YtfP